MNIYTNKSLRSDKELTYQEMSDFLPSGWNKFAIIILNASIITGAKIKGLDIRDSVLYIKDQADEYTHKDLFKRICKTIMMDSSLTCIACGANGRRRKTLQGKPALCRSHFVEFMNKEE